MADAAPRLISDSIQDTTAALVALVAAHQAFVAADADLRAILPGADALGELAASLPRYVTAREALMAFGAAQVAVTAAHQQLHTDLNAVGGPVLSKDAAGDPMVYAVGSAYIGWPGTSLLPDTTPIPVALGAPTPTPIVPAGPVLGG